MLIYSILPPEMVFDDSTDRPAPQWSEAVLADGSVRVILRVTGQGPVVERVLATDPRVYLDPALAPGTPFRGRRAGS